jgi:ribosomal-protein-alanine N-acetyltransferase
VTSEIRPLRGRDVWQVLTLQRRAFPEDPWTPSTAAGLLARLTRGGRAGYSGLLAGLIRFLRLNEAAGLARLAALVTLGRPHGLSYLVAEAGGQVTGYASLHVTAGRDAEIPMIAVRADRRGERIGTRLIAELIAMAETAQSGGVFLYVRSGNSTAHHLYERAGFADTGVLPGYYQPSGTDAIVMRLPLNGRRPAPPRQARV